MGNLGDMKKLYDSYKKLEDSLKNTVIRAKEGGIVIDITAQLKVKKVTIEDESLLSIENKETLEEAIQACFEKGQNKAQEIQMDKTKEILGFDPKDLLGGMAGGGMPNIPGLG